MDNEELINILNEIKEHLTSQDIRIQQLEEKDSQRDYDAEKADFASKYESRLSPYLDQEKAKYGDDYDLIADSFAKYKSEEGVDADAFIDFLEEDLKETAEKIKAAYGITDPDAEVTVTNDSVVVEGSDVSEEETREETKNEDEEESLEDFEESLE